MPADLKAAIQHCAHFPRILNVVQDNRDAMPWITSTKELKLQLQAISNKLLATTQLHDKLNKRLTACKTKTNRCSCCSYSFRFSLLCLALVSRSRALSLPPSLPPSPSLSLPLPLHLSLSPPPPLSLSPAALS